MMTKKDFVALAKALRAARLTPMNDGGRHWNEAITDNAHAIASVCAASNPAFDRARFLAACGVDDER